MRGAVIGAGLLSAVVVSGCWTEPTRRIAANEETEVTAGFAESDLRIVVSQAIADIDQASRRYEVAGKRRIVNVQPFMVDTTSRGSQAGYLADSLKLYFEEELAKGGKFVVYNEAFAVAQGGAAARPEFLLTGKLREQNVRRDNGNYYKETSLLLRLTDVATGLDLWQKRVPLQKAVDVDNVLN